MTGSEQLGASFKNRTTRLAHQPNRQRDLCPCRPCLLSPTTLPHAVALLVSHVANCQIRLALEVANPRFYARRQAPNLPRVTHGPGGRAGDLQVRRLDYF
mmetsp:Transcript_4390/g.13956  ORF Transcript_4390/g.13956 Transcript_4390/m.13956 type:complete len:100 (+) Transcript_4390:1334-1633(+)